jgi:hypothetical protein
MAMSEFNLRVPDGKAPIGAIRSRGRSNGKV